MNTYAIIILIALVANHLLRWATGYLSTRSFQPEVPDEFSNLITDEKYATAKKYASEKHRFSSIHGALDLAIFLAFWFSGGFEWLDGIVQGIAEGPISRGLIYIGTIVLVLGIINLPFQLWSTFVIEERYGFNRTTVKTFVLDTLKGLGLAAVLGGILLLLVLWFFQWAGNMAWLWCWLALTAFSLGAMFVAPRWILPLFSKFTSLEEGDLRDSIEQLSRSADFPVREIYVVDGSRRSSKANAFFTGFGRNRRIGLYDTLLEKLSPSEIVAVVAHEIGHYKLHHIWKGAILSIGEIGMFLWIMSFFLEEEGLFDAFYVSDVSIYVGFILFSFLFSPLARILSVATGLFSRKWEFLADRFAVETTGAVDALAGGLKKLSVDHLSNLTPHPVDVFFNFSHPPALYRIRAIKEFSSE